MELFGYLLIDHSENFVVQNIGKSFGTQDTEATDLNDKQLSLRTKSLHFSIDHILQLQTIVECLEHYQSPRKWMGFSLERNNSYTDLEMKQIRLLKK